MIKQVLVVRKDLDMGRGKIGAQCAHASMAVFFNRMRHKRKTGTTLDLGGLDYEFTATPEMAEWIDGATFTKPVLRVDSEQELDEIYFKAKEAGLPCALIVDSGKTEFHGVPTKTVVAIGPSQSEDIDKITGGLKLL